MQIKAAAVSTPHQAPSGACVVKALECRAVDEERRTADFVASTDVVDSYDEVIDQASWRLDDYVRNPVVLFAHKSRELPIGKSIETGVVQNKLQIRVQFATAEMNPEAERVYQMVRGKFLNAVSVGFLPSNGKYEMREGREVWVWSGCVLKEVSVTPVPANPEALAKMKALFGGRDETKALRSPEIERTKDEALAAERAKEAVVMTEKEMQELLEKQAREVAQAKLEAKTAGDAHASSSKRVAELEEHVSKAATEKAAFEAQTASLAKERDVALARATAAEGRLIELEVDALVGKKITPAEKTLFVDLRKTNEDLFKRMIAERKDMQLEAQIVPPAKAGDGASDLLDELNGGKR